MTAPQQPQADGGIVQTQIGLAETPLGQRVALVLTVLLPKDAALGVADAVVKAAEAMSASGLIVANGNASAVAQRP
jgi:hypothetical protein